MWRGITLISPTTWLCSTRFRKNRTCMHPRYRDPRISSTQQASWCCASPGTTERATPTRAARPHRAWQATTKKIQSKELIRALARSTSSSRICHRRNLERVETQKQADHKVAGESQSCLIQDPGQTFGTTFSSPSAPMPHYSNSELNIAKLFVCGSLVENCPKPKTARIAPWGQVFARLSAVFHGDDQRK